MWLIKHFQIFSFISNLNIMWPDDTSWHCQLWRKWSYFGILKSLSSANNAVSGPFSRFISRTVDLTRGTWGGSGGGWIWGGWDVGEGEGGLWRVVGVKLRRGEMVKDRLASQQTVPEQTSILFERCRWEQETCWKHFFVTCISFLKIWDSLSEP